MQRQRCSTAARSAATSVSTTATAGAAGWRHEQAHSTGARQPGAGQLAAAAAAAATAATSLGQQQVQQRLVTGGACAV